MTQWTLEVKVLDPRLGDEWPMPAYATESSAGLDLRAALESPLILAPGETALIPSGLAIHLADAVCMMLGIGVGADGLTYTVDKDTMPLLGYDGPRLERLIDTLEPLLTTDDLSL